MCRDELIASTNMLEMRKQMPYPIIIVVVFIMLLFCNCFVLVIMMRNNAVCQYDCISSEKKKLYKKLFQHLDSDMGVGAGVTFTY